MIILYDQDLDPDSPITPADFAVNWNGGPLTEISVVILGPAVYVGVAERMSPAIVSVDFTGELLNLDGEAAATFATQLATNTTPAADVTAPDLLAAVIDAGNVHLYFSETLDPASVPDESAFVVSVDGAAVTLGTPVLIYGIRVTIPLAESVGAEAVSTLTYTPPVSDALQDYAPNLVGAIPFTILLENQTETQAGFWTTRAKVENRWGEENTRIWSNKGNTDLLADPIAWQEVLSDTDAKFNYEFFSRDYAVPPWAANDASPVFAYFKTLADIWAGTELYFGRGFAQDSGDQDQRDKMQGWRDYVEAKIERAFEMKLDISLVSDDVDTLSGGAGIIAVQPDDSCSIGSYPGTFFL